MLYQDIKESVKDEITTMKINAGKVEEIEQAAKGVDAIINLTLPQFNTNVMKAALRSGALWNTQYPTLTPFLQLLRKDWRFLENLAP